MGDETLKYMRSDTARGAFGKVRQREDPRLGARMVALDGEPDPEKVTTVLIGVADDRGIGLAGGRLGASEGPLRFRDYFWRLHAPDDLTVGSLLDAGDMVSAARTNETHARLTEVVDVLRDRFAPDRMILVGGGHDHVFGEVLGLARWLRRGNDTKEVRIAHVCIDARPNAHSGGGEPNATGSLRRLLLEPAARVDGKSVVVWGLQRAETADKHVEFLQAQGVQITTWDTIEADPKNATDELVEQLAEFAKTHDAVSLSVDLSVFSQDVAPGVSSPSALGVRPASVLAAIEALHGLSCATQLGIYELNPRFDRDGATGRLAARLAWSYVVGP